MIDLMNLGRASISSFVLYKAVTPDYWSYLINSIAFVIKTCKTASNFLTSFSSSIEDKKIVSVLKAATLT
jgi:hypothetical protein